MHHGLGQVTVLLITFFHNHLLDILKISLKKKEACQIISRISLPIQSGLFVSGIGKHMRYLYKHIA